MKGKKQRKGGRPSKFTPSTIRKILNGIRVGASIKHSALSAGVSEDIVHKWLNRGEREASGPYYNFRVAIKEREGAAVKRWLNVIDKAAANGQWAAAAWKLERIYPEQYSRPPIVRIEPQQLSDEELEGRIRSLIGKVGIVGLASRNPPKPGADGDGNGEDVSATA